MINVDDNNVFLFAAARMALFSALKCNRGVSKSDVLVTAGTCSVVVNAILRAGFTPVFVDVSMATFGTCPKSVRSRINEKTAAVIVQHNFGIPSDVLEIRKICDDLGVILIEDCALSYCSTVSEQAVGTIGDFAIFSFDSSKPVNYGMGGALLINNENYFLDVASTYQRSQLFPDHHAKRILQRVNNRSKRQGSLVYYLWELSNRFSDRIPFISPSLLTDDFSLKTKSRYPYPAKFPYLLRDGLIASLGQFEKQKNDLMGLIPLYISFMSDIPDTMIPAAYSDSSLSIVPLRLIGLSDNIEFERNLGRLGVLSEFPWFRKPVISTRLSASEFGYRRGSCANFEFISKKVFNIELGDISRVKHILKSSYWS